MCISVNTNKEKPVMKLHCCIQASYLIIMHTKNRLPLTAHSITADIKLYTIQERMEYQDIANIPEYLKIC